MYPAKSETLHYIKGLLYASAMNSNYYQPSDFNVNYEFDILTTLGKSLRNKDQIRIGEWKYYLKEKLSHWLFRHMPANTPNCNRYVKDFLIAEIIRNLEKIFSKDVVVFEVSKTLPGTEGFELIFDDGEFAYYILIEINDSFVIRKTLDIASKEIE
jgi:hypothetical protein